MALLSLIQALAAALLMASILLQQRGTGLGGVFGGSSGVYRAKRGAEKTLFQSTIVLSILFFGSTLLDIILG